MKVPQRCHRRWAAGLAAIVLVASPATSRAAQPTSAPAPVAPAPTPTTTEPAPAKPAPVKPDSVEPAPAEPGPAASPTAGGPDEVVLKNGGFVRGTVVELMPDEQVVIVPDGSSERRTIAWSEVERVDRGKHAPPPAEPAPPAQPEPAAAMPTTPPPDVPVASGTRIHIETTSDREVTLHEIEAELVASGYNASLYGMSWRNVCVAPCNRTVDGSRGQEFFVTTGGSLHTASRRLRFTEDGRDVTLLVKPGNGPMRVTGVILASIAPALIIGGALFLGLNKSFDSPTLRNAGIGMLAFGVPALVIGLPLAIVGRTRVEKQ